MNGLTTETTEAAPATAKPETAKKKTTSRATKPRVATTTGKASKKATPAKKRPKSALKAKIAKPAKAAKGTAREGSKTEKILALLKRSGGVTLKELMTATGWQAHSVRGFLSAAVGKKMGLTVVSAKEKDGERNYSVKA